MIRANKQRCLDLSEAIKKEISNTHLRLGEESFSMDLIIMRKYIEILGHELFLSEPVISRLLADEEILSQEIAGGVRKQLEGLVEELILGLEARAGGSIAFFGFTSGDGEATSLQHTADRIAHSRLAKFPNFLIIGEQTVDEALAQLEISRRSLLDNTIALKVGALLSADFLLIGRIVEMPNSVVVFGKLLNCGSGAVESVAQIILPRDD